MNRRQIKFRIWDTRYNRYLAYTDMSLCNNPEYIFQEWTGLTDKKGKEIYEGDILSQFSITGKYFLPLYPITFRQGTFGHCFDGDNLPFQILDEKAVEIVGNIFENKDLL